MKVDISSLYNEIVSCTDCRLSESRRKAVPGYGNVRSDILFVGEAPGYNEDLQGKPFVGKAGDILDVLLFYIGLTREDVYIANVVKCRPPDNRNPMKDEILACKKYLFKQIEIIKPRVICTLGKFAAEALIKPEVFKPMNEMHGKLFKNRQGIVLLASYHPAYALYDKGNLPILKEDFHQLMNLIK